MPSIVDCLIERAGPGQFTSRARFSSRVTSSVNPVTTPRNDEQEAEQPDRHLVSDSSEHHDSCETQAEPDLLYLEILNKAVKDNAEPREPRSLLATPSTLSSAATPQQRPSTTHSHLNDVDNDYLVRKGVYDLPHTQQVDALVNAYFDHVHPYAPAVNRSDFVHQYRSGSCSLFLLHAILTSATLNASTVVLSDCGFSSRSEAQEHFFTKARLLHDFMTEDDPLSMLQGSIALCMVVLDHPTDKDFGYWFHNAVRIATKLDVRNICIQEDKPCKIVRLYRRIWWTLHSFDVFRVFANIKCTRLLEPRQKIKPRQEDDWEADDLASGSSGWLTAVTPQQRTSSVAQCELSRIFEECMSTVMHKPQQDPRRLLDPLDVWRKALPARLHVENDTKTDVYYLNMQATSYRYECSLCRQICHVMERSNRDGWIEWTKQRLRSAILELDTIVMRVLASETLQYFPIYFITTLTMLLAIHIEAILDPKESALVHSMSRISISQIMLVLSQGKEIPALKRALPIFEEILAKKKLRWAMPEHDQTAMQIQPQQDAQEHGAGAHDAQRIVEGDPVPQMHGTDVTFESASGLLLQQFEADADFDTDFSTFDFLYDWPFG